MKRRPPAAEEVAPDVARDEVARLAIAMHRRSILDHANRDEARALAEELRDLSRAPSPDLEKARELYHRLPWRTP